MNPGLGGGRAGARNPVFRCLESKYRRELLGALLRWAGVPQTERKLAAYVAATDRGLASPDQQTIRNVRLELRHVHLSMLEAAGLVAWDADDGTVETADHPALDDPRFEQLLAIDAEGLDDVFAALSHEYRHVALAILSDGRASASRTELAREIRSRNAESPGSATPPVDEVSLLLHHVDLPMLDDAGFIEYDAETGFAAYAGNDTLEDVLEAIYGRDETTADKLEGLFDGLQSTYRQVSERSPDRSERAHFWGDPSDG